MTDMKHLGGHFEELKKLGSDLKNDTKMKAFKDSISKNFDHPTIHKKKKGRGLDDIEDLDDDDLEQIETGINLSGQHIM